MRDHIWFTYKARIRAHQRLERLSFHSQCLLVWYAFLGAALSVVTIRYSDALGDNTDVLAAILSVALLAISLLLGSRDFRGRSIFMMQNYLDLQKLYQSTSESCAKQSYIEDYHRLLREGENHREIDDVVARVFAHGDTTRPPNNWEKISASIWWVSSRLVIAALYVAPVLVPFLVWQLQ